MEGHFGSLKGQNLGKGSGRIRIMQEQIERYTGLDLRQCERQDPDPDPHQSDADPQHYLQELISIRFW